MFTRLYLHIPFCRRKCPYCAFVSREVPAGVPGDYVELLLEEMRLARAETSGNAPLDSLYLGGGTPSLLTPGQVARLLDRATDLFGAVGRPEITIEANPGTVDRDLLAGFRAAGINRLSLGIQSFDDRMLSALGRLHSSQQARDALEAARRAGFDNIGIDLIHALPGQTAPMWRSDLEQALRLAPEHISVYGLTIEEGTSFALLDADGKLPREDDDGAADMFEMAGDLLAAGGYEHYEIANHALPGRRARHNSGYWRREGYLGLGAGAHSFLRGDGYGVRFSNPAKLEDYAAAIRRGVLPRLDPVALTREDALAEFMFLGLRMTEGVDRNEGVEEFGIAPVLTFERVVGKLVTQGLLESDGAAVRLTRRGMLLSNQVFSRFLP